MNAATLALAVLGTAGGAYAQPVVEVAVAFVPARVLLGAPFAVRILLTNSASTPILVPSSRHIVLAMRWEVPQTEGIMASRGGPTSTAQVTTEPLLPGQTKRYDLCVGQNDGYLPRFCQAGNYSLQLVVDMRRWVTAGEAWVATSPEAKVDVVQPGGEDAEAFLLLSTIPKSGREGVDVQCVGEFVTHRAESCGRDLLQKFPTSTYAAYLVWERSHARDMAGWRPSDLLDSVERGLPGVVPISVPCLQEGCKEASWSLRGSEALAWCEKWFNLVLQAHPDIWFADELRLRIALDELISGKGVAGAGGLEALAKSGRPDIAEKAGRLLTLVKEKGLVK